MNGYYLQINGEKRGPFSIGELAAEHLTRDTQVMRVGNNTWVPAHEVADLSALFADELPADPDAAWSAKHGSEQDGARVKPGSQKKVHVRVGLWIGGIVALVIAIGIGIYFMAKKREVAQPHEDITAIHAREVQKAIDELNSEKLAKKAAEERKASLKMRRAELQSLNAQLRKAAGRRAEALSELDDIRRPHLFRSRARKEYELSEQLEIIDRLDAKAAALRNKVSACQAAIDSLSRTDHP